VWSGQKYGVLPVQGVRLRIARDMAFNFIDFGGGGLRIVPLYGHQFDGAIDAYTGRTRPSGAGAGQSWTPVPWHILLI
jgi:hypothetical protein